MVVKAEQELDAIGKERIAIFEVYAAGRVGEMEYITRRAELAEMSKRADARLKECVQLKGQMEADIQRVKTALSRDAGDALGQAEAENKKQVEESILSRWFLDRSKENLSRMFRYSLSKV